MTNQLNASNARERERMKARYNIRERIAKASAPAFVESSDETSEEVIYRYLRYIRQGDKSKFGTTTMDKNVSLLSSPHSEIGRAHV